MLQINCMHMWQHDVDGKAYYTFEFVAQAPNFTRHALSTITIGNGTNLYFYYLFLHTILHICQSVFIETTVLFFKVEVRSAYISPHTLVFQWDLLAYLVWIFLFFFSYGREVLHFDNGGKREKMGQDERQIKHSRRFLQNLQCLKTLDFVDNIAQAIQFQYI